MPHDLDSQEFSSVSLAETIGQLALSKKADQTLIVDVRNLTTITDFFMICSANTEIQVKGIADAISRGTPSKPWRIEGYGHNRWVLLDYVDVVAHVFKTSEREFYNLERLWADAPTQELTDEPASTPITDSD